MVNPSCFRAKTLLDLGLSSDIKLSIRQTKGNTMGSQEDILNRRQRSVLVGKILGDGTIENNGRYSRVRICQSDKQKDFVDWLYKEFTNFATKKPRFVISKSRYRNVGQYRFDTFSLPVFKRYRNIFYKNKVKIIPNNIGDLLKDPISLAVWYMDDGYKRTDNSGLYLCTSSFTIEEHHILQECLFTNFGIETNIHFAGGYARLHIPSRCIDIFSKHTKQYIISSLRYKLP